MKILIEDARTLEFLAADGSWAKKPEKGASFANTRAAKLVAAAEAIGSFNIVRYFHDTKQFVNMDHGVGKAGAPKAA